MGLSLVSILGPQLLPTRVFPLVVLIGVGSVFGTDATAQVRIDGTLFAQKFDTRAVYGPGGGLHFSFFDYALEIVASGGFYHTPDDGTESWNVRVDTRLNLPTGRAPVRPYIGLGLDRTVDDGVRTTSGAALGGVYLNILSDRVHPFAEAWYRSAPKLDDFRFRAGLRFQFLDPR